MNKHQLEKTLEGLVSRREILDDWSIGFLESVQEQHNNGRTLSERQIEIVRRIESENSEEVMRQHLDFSSTWESSGCKEKWDVCIAYYEAGKTYNRRSVHSARKNKNYIPTLKEYRRVCENKYAAGVIRAWFSEPLYPPTSLVRFRSTAPYRHRISSSTCLVVKTNASKPTSHAKGAKVYLVMPLGETQPIYIEERHLKKFKRS